MSAHTDPIWWVLLWTFLGAFVVGFVVTVLAERRQRADVTDDWGREVVGLDETPIYSATIEHVVKFEALALTDEGLRRWLHG